jgi:4-amino-4-deoxy-L-arabinose transferase-like glycosyltransferase
MGAASVEGFIKKHAVRIAVALVAIASVRIASTWTVFNHTADEAAHISCGMELLSSGNYHYEHQHPPLTRVMVALGPYLMGERTTGLPEMTYDGLVLLYKSGRYDALLAASRAGNLPLFWLACLFTFLWGRRMAGPPGGALAVFVFTTLPLVLAHGGLSTTDMGLTAFFAAASYGLVLCVSEPGWKNGMLFGVLLGGMALSKFSGFAYLPAAAAVSVAGWWWKERPGAARVTAEARRAAAPVALGLGVSVVVVWAGYLFSFGKSGWFSFPVPFPELFSGIDQVKKHNAEGHLAYLLGDLSMKGWWLFFPLLILVKTPIAALLAAGAGLGVKRRSEGAWPGWLPWAVMGAMLAVAMSGRINIGLRHLLPGFVFLAVSAGSGLLSLLERAAARRWAYPAAGVLAAWLVLTGAAAHPDYLPYFNALAGEHPENIVVDSDLDWGQDMKRLGQRLRELNAPYVTFTNHVPANLDAFGFPPRQHSDAEQPAPGWNAVSLTEWKLYRFGLQLQNPEVKMWPDQVKPSEMVGKTILLYYFSPAGGGR